MQITILLGTARRDNVSQHVAHHNVSQHVAHHISEAVTTAGGTATLATVAEHLTQPVTVPPWGAGGADEQPTKWKQLVADTDVFVFVLPEYNHGYPGEWKLLMDTLFGEYAGKRVYIAGVGGGQFAGARVVEHVLPLLVNFKFEIAPERLYVSAVAAKLAEDNRITDPATCERIEAFATAIAKHTS